MCFISQNSLCNKNLLKTQNPQLINKRGFKLRVAYDGARMVHIFQLHFMQVQTLQYQKKLTPKT